MPNEFHGIVVYEVKPDGCLNAIWTNDHAETGKEIFNEIAKKKGGGDKGCLEGSYASAWIENDGHISTGLLAVAKGELVIKKEREVYIFIWKNESGDKEIYNGIGLRTGNTVSVAYWNC
jgi:hypothetical protein